MRHAVRLCRACGCLFRDPVWDDAELELIYSPEVWRLVEPYRPNTPEARANNHERRQRMAERILAEVPADGAARAIGDVGGRDGFYVAPFLDHGWSATVIDPADAPVVDTRIVRDPVTLARHAGPPAFDALVLSHVLEHVVDLAGFLGDVRRVLRPGGLVYTEVPYEVRRVLLRADLGDPSHQIYFATRTLRHLFEVAGFAVRRCARERTTYDEARIFAIVIIAEPDGRSAGRPLPPGAFHVLAEMLSSARAALAHASS
jgi:SAM-dependent methyltransferase